MLDLLRSVTVYKGLQIGSDMPSSLGLVFVIVFFVIVAFVIVIVVVVLLLLWSLLCTRFHSNFYCLRFISSPQEGTYYFVNPVDHYCSSGPQRVKILRYIHPYVVLLYAFSKIFVEAAKDVGEVFCHLRCQ